MKVNGNLPVPGWDHRWQNQENADVTQSPGGDEL